MRGRTCKIGQRWPFGISAHRTKPLGQWCNSLHDGLSHRKYDYDSGPPREIRFEIAKSATTIKGVSLRRACHGDLGFLQRPLADLRDCLAICLSDSRALLIEAVFAYRHPSEGSIVDVLVTMHQSAFQLRKHMNERLQPLDIRHTHVELNLGEW